MRTIIQRVTKASVTVGDELISSIGRGLCILVGISKDDTPKEREYLVRKILNLRLFDDENDKRWVKSVRDKQLEILCVSQFTLYSILKGNKPDFHQAMPGDQSEVFYNEFLEMLRKDYEPDKIKDGKFGANMQVHIQNDGPVTIQLDSPPDSSVSTVQESSGNADLVRHSRQALANLKRNHGGLPAGSERFGPLQTGLENEQLENSDGYLACSVCSNGLTHVDAHHLTTTVCGHCGRGLHQDCSVLHQCDLNSDTEGTNTKTEDAEVDSIMVHAPARVCVECHQQGGVLTLCTGCDHNLHEVCRAHHECPALVQHRPPTLSLSQVLHKKYSKYGHRANTAKPPQVPEPKKSFRLERYKTKKDCCVCSNRGIGIQTRRRSQTVCYYCKKGLHWECRFRHNCELMTSEPVQPSDGGSIVIFLTGGNRKRRDCIVCSQRKLGQRHRSRTICKFCKKGLHRKCEHKHLCPWVKNAEEVTENEVHKSFDGIPKKKRKTAPKACSTLVDSSSREPHLANQMTAQSIDRSISSTNHQLISHAQLNSHIPCNTQQGLLSSLQLRPHQPRTNMHETTLAQTYGVIAQPSATLAQTSTALVKTSPTSVRIENTCELNAKAVNQTDVILAEEHNFLQSNTENKRKPTIVRIPGNGLRDGRKDCIVCSSRTCWGRRKRAYTQCSLCKKGLHFKCRQLHICGQKKKHPKFDVPTVSSAVDDTTLFGWVDKPDGTAGEPPQQLSDSFSQGDNPEAEPMLVKCSPQCLVDCQECAFHDGNKKMTHLMCSVCRKGVHKKCFYRHRCYRDQESTEAHAPGVTTGTFVGERPSVVRIQSAEVKDGRKACDVCAGKVRDGKRHRSRTQCVVCRRGLHIRCVSQHICPGSSSNNSNNSSFTGVATIPNDVEIKDIREQPSLEPNQQHLSTPSTSSTDFMEMDRSSVPMNDRRNRNSQLLKTGQDKFCTVCPSGQKTRMACRLCKENVHPRCEWRHFCKVKDASGRNTPPITGGRFTGEVVPIPSSDVKTRKKDCAVCSNRKAGRRSRSSTMCPHCRKGLHRICAPQHMCPMISPPQDSPDFVEVGTPGNPEPFADEDDDDDDDMGYVEVTDGITRYCCVCSTSRKSQITRTACSSCDRGLHPQCVLLHNCHSMVPRRLQIPSYRKQARYEGDVTQDVEIVRSSTAVVDEGETSDHQGDGVHEIIDDEDEYVVEVPTSDSSPKEIGEVSQPSKGFDTGVTSVSVHDEGKGISGEVKKYLLVTDDSSEEISRDEEMLSVEDPSEGDSSVDMKGKKVAESKEEVDDLRSDSVEDGDLNEEHYVLTNNSESPQVSVDVPQAETRSDSPVTYLLINRNEPTGVSSKVVDGSSVEVVRPTLAQSELILECSNGPEDMQIGCFSNLEDMSSNNQIHNEGTAQDLDDIVAQIREELHHVVGDAGHMMDLHQIEGEVLAIQPDGV